MTDLDGRLGARQIQGDRDYQEDDFGISHVHQLGDAGEHILLVLADGMGGHVAGATASALAVRRFVEAFEELDGTVAQRLRFALDAANDEIRKAIEVNPEMDGMGCTLVGVSIADAGIQWVSVGDSPLWVFHKGELTRLNADHSMAPVIANLVEAGHLTPEEAASDKRKNALRSAVMGDDMELVDLKEEPVEVKSEARIVVASDGLETLDVEELSAILKEYEKESARDAVGALIAGVEAKAKPGQDNTTVLLFEPGDFLGGEEDSMKPEEVKSIVRRAKGLKKGETATDPRTIPGAKDAAPGGRPAGLIAVIALLLLALVGALIWIFLIESERLEEPAVLPPTPGEEAPIPEEGEEIEKDKKPVEGTEPPDEEPVVEKKKEVRPIEAEGSGEKPVELEEDPGQKPSLIPSGGEGGGKQPSEGTPGAVEEGKVGTGAPGGQPGVEKKTPASGTEKDPEGAGEKKKEKKEEKKEEEKKQDKAKEEDEGQRPLQI